MVVSNVLFLGREPSRIKLAQPSQKDATSCSSRGCSSRRSWRARIWRRNQQAAWFDSCRNRKYLEGLEEVRPGLAPRLASSTLPSSSSSSSPPTSSSSSWSAEKSEAMYNMGQWSCGYYSVAETGEVLVKPRGDQGPSHRMDVVVEACVRSGATLPLLLCFPDIFRDRIRKQHACFLDSIGKYDYKGSYCTSFPVKANHSPELISTLVSMNGETHRCSLEVGSKPELLVALAHACSSNCTLKERGPEAVQIICNGFKDEKYIQLALLAQKFLGADIFLCIDRYEELDLVIKCSKALGIAPTLGVRAKLNTKHEGHWGSTSGYISKFGLRVREIVTLVSKLKECNMLDCLQMLHFHLGSQIDDILVVKSAMRESCSIFSELYKMGAPLSVIDVGGGLAITYDGEKGAWHPKYTMQNYANDIVAAVNDMCVQRGIPAPVIVTESGRSLASHHSLLVFDADYRPSKLPPSVVHTANNNEKEKESSQMSYFFATFEEVYEDLLTAAASRGDGNFEEACNDALQFKKEAESAFTLGLMSIGEFAYAEELFDKIMSRVLELKKYDIKGEGSLEAAKLSQAIPCFANLSIFRSAIDSWAIDQSFPIVPVSGLHEKPNNVAKLYDLTCDSDGEIKNFVTSKGSLSPVLPVRCDGSGSFRFALFLLGAYQQSMGNYHNLFGRTCEATVTFPDCSSNQKKNEEGRIKVARLNPAETTAEILRNASYSPESMRAQISQALERQPSQYNSSEETSLLLAALDDFVESSSYLED